MKVWHPLGGVPPLSSDEGLRQAVAAALHEKTV